MPHELRRVLRAFATTPWFIEPRAANKIMAVLEYRSAHGPRAAPYREEPADPQPVRENRDSIAILNLMGPIVPRSNGIDDISESTASMERFMQAFDQAASNENITSIVLNIDSPGGAVDLVPEVADKIRAARNSDRPIIAVANTMAASAAYWIASAADELVVTPSGEVGSVGVYMLHQEISKALEDMGVVMTFISEGPRKVEGNPFEPLGDEARDALQETVAHYYDMFTKAVAKNRGVSVKIVKADPVKSERHFGGGRTYPAQTAVRLGMADRVESLESVLASLQGRRHKRRRRGQADDVRPITFTQKEAGGKVSVYAAETWPQETSAMVNFLASSVETEFVFHDTEMQEVTFRTANGWARYRMVDHTSGPEGGWYDLSLIASHWEPVPEPPKPRKANKARRRLALIT